MKTKDLSFSKHKNFIIILTLFFVSWIIGLRFVSLGLSLTALSLAICKFKKISFTQSGLLAIALFTSFNCLVGIVGWIFKFEINNYAILFILSLIFFASLKIIDINKVFSNVRNSRLKLNTNSKFKLLAITGIAIVIFGGFFAKLNSAYTVQLFLFGGG